MSTQHTLKTLAAQVRANVTYGAKLAYDKQDDWQRGARGYSVTLYYKRRRMTVDFWMGQAHTKEPTAEDVLECLLSEASGFDNARSFEDWCAEYGFDTDSRKAERMYKQIERQREKLQTFLGEQYETFMYANRE